MFPEKREPLARRKTGSAWVDNARSLQEDKAAESLRTHSFAFDHSENAIYARNRNLFDGAARPVNFDLIDFGGRPQTEMDTQIGAGTVAAAAEDIGALPNAPGGEENFSPDGIARALWATDLLQSEPVI